MSGNQDSDKPKFDKFSVSDWDVLLDEYEKNLGLPKFEQRPEHEVTKYFGLSRDQIEKFAAADCAEIAFVLTDYAFYIGRAYNREVTRVNWAKAQIKQVIATDIGQQEGYGYEEKSAKAIKANDVASKLYNISIYAQQRADRLSYLSASIKNLSEMLIAVQRSKQQWKNQT